MAEANLTSHPLLSRPSPIAIVAPVLPARIFLPTQVGVDWAQQWHQARPLWQMLWLNRRLFKGL